MTDLYRAVYRHLDHPADVAVPILCAIAYVAAFAAVVVLILRAVA